MLVLSKKDLGIPSPFLMQTSVERAGVLVRFLRGGYMFPMKIPSICAQCPLKESLTRNCGKLIDNPDRSSEGINIYKIPDHTCLLRGVQIPERYRGTEYG
jgi:hypothetical protein